VAAVRRASWALVLVCVAWACGYSVSPRGGFEDPAAVPLPTDLGAFATQNGIEVTWIAEDEIFAVIEGWYLYRAAGEVAPLADAYRRLTPGILVEKAYNDRDIEDGVRYWYRITSVTPALVESLPSEAVSARVDFTAPLPPTNLRAAVEVNPGGGVEVRLHWDPVEDPELRHYNLYRNPADPLLPIITDLFQPAFVDIRVQRGERYVYRVTAVDEVFNESAPSDSVEVEIPLAF
jgi:hypothetical protein